ncbi:SCO1664 family protein [Nocardioides convexus]|uniref:SCO1664 family protein n=1 Tax=Nocardioides convexus TaxID=2712224 RepID=UPI003101B201
MAGERPLWDFPDGTLADREVAAYLVSDATGWDVVPRTWWAEGPHGPGMVQEWREVDPEQDAVDLVRSGTTPEGWLEVFDGLDDRDRPVTLVHEDTAPLRRMAVLDVVINNADRKGGHVLAMPGGHRHGVDHGIAFHHEPKAPHGAVGLGRAATDRRGDLGGDRPAGRGAWQPGGGAWASTSPSTRSRRWSAARSGCSRPGSLPGPHGGWPPIPWPPF